MRLNQYIALHTGVSRRRADELIQHNKVLVNHRAAHLGQIVESDDRIEVNRLELKRTPKIITIILNKPVGYVCSRAGQGSRTIYDILPQDFHHLKPVGRLDKDSSGLLLITNDGRLANELTHPSHQKQKIYIVELDRPLTADDAGKIEKGILLDDGVSQLYIKLLNKGQTIEVKMYEGRNRQIRRTFSALGYKVEKLHRTHFGKYSLKLLSSGKWENTV